MNSLRAEQFTQERDHVRQALKSAIAGELAQIAESPQPEAVRLTARDLASLLQS